MIEKLIDIIKYDSESAHVDFKLLEYPLGKHAKKNELLKDICAMANHPADDPKYIIIGVKEEKGVVSEVIGVEAPTDQAQYQQFVDSNIEPRINFEYLTFEYEGSTLTAFVIKGNQQRPYLFKKEVKRPTDNRVEYRIGDGFIRSGTSSRKLNRKDLEDIYARRQQARDRKLDLKITPVIKKWDPFFAYAAYWWTIDFKVENLSSKSIGFDAELKLFYTGDMGVQNAEVFLAKRREGQGSTSIYTQQLNLVIENIDIYHYDEYFKISRRMKGIDKYTVMIAQKDTEERLFFSEVLVNIGNVAPPGTVVEAELILRSDEFQDGPIVERYSFDALDIEKTL